MRSTQNNELFLIGGGQLLLYTTSHSIRATDCGPQSSSSTLSLNSLAALSVSCPFEIIHVKRDVYIYMRKSQVDRKVVKYTTTVSDDDDELAQVFILEHFYIHLSIQYRT